MEEDRGECLKTPVLAKERGLMAKRACNQIRMAYLWARLLLVIII
jgi:hypothetical protein